MIRITLANERGIGKLTFTRHLHTTTQIDNRPEPSLLAICRAWLGDDGRETPYFEANLGLQAARHGLLGVLHRSGGTLPDDLRRTARRTYDEQAAAVLLVRLQLQELGAAFAADGIPLIALKGAAAALSLYADPPCRRLRDLDLLIPESCIRAARRIMATLGYTPERNRSTQEEEDALLPLTHLQPYRRDDRLPVEIHTSLLQGRSPDREAQASEDIFREAIPLAPIAAVMRLSARHFAVHAALHYTKDLDDGFAELKGLLDLILTLRTTEASAVREVARRWNVEPEVDLALACAHAHLGVGPPCSTAPVTLSQLLDGGPARSMQRRYRAMLTAARRVPGAKARARYLLRLMIPSPDKLRHHYDLPENEPLGKHYARHVVGVAGRFLRSFRRAND